MGQVTLIHERFLYRGFYMENFFFRQLFKTFYNSFSVNGSYLINGNPSFGGIMCYFNPCGIGF